MAREAKRGREESGCGFCGGADRKRCCEKEPKGDPDEASSG